ncbi:MAG: sugar isomerase [Armatimonadetes bacterium]|nr:sugar isomerase [Armatimonadota bacterium]MCX7968229.1 sugar isomerase [Armatimonadota bacterium]MDW8142112.1 sugar isomerase [Armatimonadota bacterium]
MRGDGVRMSRRNFLAIGSLAILSPALEASSEKVLPPSPDFRLGGRPLIVKPVLTYGVYRRLEATSWRPWGGIETEADADKELVRIRGELKRMQTSADFPFRFLEPSKVANPSQVANLTDIEKADALIVYASGAWVDTFQALVDKGLPTIFFTRFRSQPYYLWHEIIHARFLRSHTDRLMQKRVSYEDVVVDDYNELLWRLRSLYGLINILGRRIVAIGGPGGWAHPPGIPSPPELARERWKLDIVTVSIPDLVRMIEAARKDSRQVEKARKEAEQYMRQREIAVQTRRDFVVEAFLLANIFRELMKQHNAYAITTNGCMGSYAGIMPCLTLSLINDAGYMAYCESDFVNIPAGILLHFIAGKPTFFCNPTFPTGEGIILFAHCTAPRFMDGKRGEPAKLVTHFESDHGAAIKVEMRKGQIVTVVNPDFEAHEWCGFVGEIVGTPFLPVCRSQVEVKVKANVKEVVSAMRGFHCTIAYGDYRKEVGYALSKVGIGWKDLSAS